MWKNFVFEYLFSPFLESRQILPSLSSSNCFSCATTRESALFSRRFFFAPLFFLFPASVELVFSRTCGLPLWKVPFQFCNKKPLFFVCSLPLYIPPFSFPFGKAGILYRDRWTLLLLSWSLSPGAVTSLH